MILDSQLPQFLIANEIGIPVSLIGIFCKFGDCSMSAKLAVRSVCQGRNIVAPRCVRTSHVVWTYRESLGISDHLGIIRN